MRSALFVSHSGEKGGAELFMIDLLINGPHNWQGCFLSGGNAVDHLRDKSKPTIELSAGSRILSIRRGSSIIDIFKGSIDLLNIARKLAVASKPYDVICANSQKALFVCAIAALISRKPLVWILHDIISDSSFSRTNRLASVIFSRLFTDIVIVNSKISGAAFVDAGGQKEKVRLVYNGFHTEQHAILSEDDRNRLQNEFGLDNRPLIGLFGRLAEWKGQHVLLGALSKIDDVQAIIVGGALFGEQDYEQHIKTLSGQLDLQERVHFLGHRTDVSQLMNLVDIVVHTSISPEPFGRVVVEGQLAERPVIATRAGGVTEIIEDEKTGVLVPPNDENSLANAIIRILADSEFARKLAVNGRQSALQRFSINSTISNLEMVLDEIV